MFYFMLLVMAIPSLYPMYFVKYMVFCSGLMTYLGDCANTDHHSNEPLILTPYLESGNILEAQNKSLVSPDIGRVRSYTGFFTVDKVCGNNLFFWFVPAEVNPAGAPVLLWLHGGPGTSSLLALFEEIGPFKYVKVSKELVKNKNRWTKHFNVIFLDQPVGTGFSFTKKGCYMKNLTKLTEEVYSAVKQFFTLFPNLLKNNFFLVGYSFAGTYQPALGVLIDKKNSDSTFKINFKGILIGNAYMDLRCQNYAPYCFETGIVEENSRDTILKYQKIRNKYINENNSSGANEYEDKIWNEEFAKSCLPSRFNILSDNNLFYLLDYQEYVNDTKIRQLIKVGNTHYNATSVFGLVRSFLSHELIVPATPNVKILLDKKYLVGFYTGQFDLECSYSSLVCVLNQLNYKEYQKAKRRGWYVGGRLAGWVRSGGRLFSAVVRNAGHEVPVDRGAALLALVEGVLGSYPGKRLNLTEESSCNTKN